MLFSKVRVSILGCGWLGLPLAKTFLSQGAIVKGSTTRQERFSLLAANGIIPYLIKLDGESIYSSDFFDCDVLFLAFPPQIKQNDNSLFGQKIKLVCQAALGRSRRVVMLSSTSVFGDEQLVVDENTVPLPNSDGGKSILSAENLFLQYSSFRSTIVRLGGLIGAQRNLARYFAGKFEVRSPLAPVNLIELNDAVAFCIALVEKRAFGVVYHAVHPHHPSRKVFYTALCEASGGIAPQFLEDKSPGKTILSAQSSERLAFTYSFDDWFIAIRQASWL